MSRTLVMLLIAGGWVPSVLAAQSDSRQLLLKELRTDRQAAVKDPARVEASKPQIDLKPLQGVSRHELFRALGLPDFCALPEDADCIKSTHVAYFFYPRQPSTARDIGNGYVQVTVTAGGGWALEIDVSKDAVSQASWVKQE